MCEYCEDGKPIVELGQKYKEEIHVKTYIEKGHKIKGEPCTHSLATELNIDGWRTTNTRPIKFCPMCGRKLD